jgi:hypothetical protein
MRLNRIRCSIVGALLFVLPVCNVGVAQAQSLPGPVLPEQIHGIWLVGARTTAAQELGNATRSTLQVTRVFSGPTIGPALLGQRIEVISANEPGSGNNRIFPAPAQGENGIWAVTRTSGGLKVLLGQRAYGLSLPSREGVTASYFTPYENALQVGLAVEKVAKLNRLETTERLKGYAFNNVPEVSAWAIASLAPLLDPDTQEAFFKSLLANTQVPLFGRLAADAQLIQLLKSDWQPSPERETVLLGWAAEPLDEPAALALTNWLRETDTISDEQRQKLTTALLNNTSLSDAVRTVVIQNLPQRG